MDLKYVIGFYIVLIVSFFFIWALLSWVDGTNSSQSIKDTVTILGGAIFGGACYAFFERGFFKK